MRTIYIVVYCVNDGGWVLRNNIMAFKSREEASQDAKDRNAFLDNFEEWYEVQELYLKES